MRNVRSDSRPGAPRARLLAGALAAAIVWLPGMANAQQANVVQRSFINLSFELPNLQAAGCRVYIGEQYVPGWTTDHRSQPQENVGNCTTPAGFSTSQSARILELWRTPRQGVNARSGNQLAELNAAVESRISQNVCLEQGDAVRWQFSHRGRNSDTREDQMEFLVGNTPIVSVGTTNTGAGRVITTSLGTANSVTPAGNPTWRDYTGSFTYNGASGITNIGFRAIPVPGGSATEGNFLDDIQVFLKPIIELTGGTYQTMEGTSNGLPTLTVVGHLEADLNVRVTVTGGTAVRGQDFTTPGGGATFNVVIPARTAPYEGEPIPLGLIAPANTTFDGTRSVEFQLEPDDDQYFTRSTTDCGAAGATSATWNILDDDADLSIEKTASTTSARTGQSVTYTLTARSAAAARINVTGAVIRDPAVTGLDCSAATPTCSATRPALCAADHSIATLQGSGMVLPEFLPGEQVQLQLVCRVTADGVAP